MPGLASTTAAGLARRVTEAQWAAVETGLGDVHATALDLLDRLDPDRAHALSAEVTIDMDTSDVEVYGRLKRGVAFNHQGQRVGRPVAPRPRRPISRASRVLGVPWQQGCLAAWGSRLRPDTDRRADTHRGVREVHGGGWADWADEPCEPRPERQEQEQDREVGQAARSRSTCSAHPTPVTAPLVRVRTSTRVG